jgi:hypothetical protein
MLSLAAVVFFSIGCGMPIFLPQEKRVEGRVLWMTAATLLVAAALVFVPIALPLKGMIGFLVLSWLYRRLFA